MQSIYASLMPPLPPLSLSLPLSLALIFVRDGIFSIIDYNSTWMGVVVVVVVVVINPLAAQVQNSTIYYLHHHSQPVLLFPRSAKQRFQVIPS